MSPGLQHRKSMSLNINHITHNFTRNNNQEGKPRCPDKDNIMIPSIWAEADFSVEEMTFSEVWDPSSDLIIYYFSLFFIPTILA